MDEDDHGPKWAAERRRRNFLVSGIVLGAVALVALVAILLGLHWAAGFVGGSAAISTILLLMWRGERRAGAIASSRFGSRGARHGPSSDQ